MADAPLLKDMGQLIGTIINDIFEPDQKRVDQMADKLVTEIVGSDQTNRVGVSYLEARFQHSSLRGRNNVRIQYVPCDEEHRPGADLIWKDMVKMRADYALIKQTLVQCLRGMQSISDVRNALPDCIIDTLDSMKPLREYKRTKPEGHNFPEAKQEEVQKNFRLIAGYTAARFFLA